MSVTHGYTGRTKGWLGGLGSTGVYSRHRQRSAAQGVWQERSAGVAEPCARLYRPGWQQQLCSAVGAGPSQAVPSRARVLDATAQLCASVRLAQGRWQPTRLLLCFALGGNASDADADAADAAHFTNLNLQVQQPAHAPRGLVVHRLPWRRAAVCRRAGSIPLRLPIVSTRVPVLLRSCCWRVLGQAHTVTATLTRMHPARRET